MEDPRLSAAEPVRLVIWDLDETFWRGTLSEGGFTWREDCAAIVVELARRGIMSSICSKNDLAEVETILRRRHLWDYFVFPSIDWSAKGPRIKQLIDAIQLRAPSVLLIDDNPLNREQARHFAPGLQVAAETIIPDLLADRRFPGKSDPELVRLKQYKALETRKAEEARLAGDAGDATAFLRASDIRVRIENDVEAHLDRAIELINRTNQLNFTKWRLPEDPEKARAKLRGQIRHFATQAGLVAVSDKYGDYGFCGYFQVTTRREVAQLQRFCFSCRILGLGVEAFVYQRLGRPVLEIKGEPRSDPMGHAPVDWIRMETGEDGASGVAAEPPLGSMAARGGCVLWPLTHYFRLSASRVTGEFNTVRDGKLIRLDHSLCLRHAILGVTGDRLAAVAPLGYVAEDFRTEFFNHEGDKPIFVFSSWVDGGLPVWRHRRSGMTIPFEPSRPHRGGEPDPALEAYVAAEFQRTRYREAEYRATLELIFSRIPPHGLMFVLLSDTPSERRQEMNDWCVAAAVGRDNIRLIRLTDFSEGDAEILNPQQTHFDRKVYHRLYEHMVAEARASLARDRATDGQTPSPVTEPSPR